MARLVWPPRLELKAPEGSSSEAPWANVSFTALLYVSPVQMIPSCDHTGTFHFHSSTTPGSACLMIARTRASVSPRQSPSSLILASISREGDGDGGSSRPPRFGLLRVLNFFMAGLAFLLLGPIRHGAAEALVKPPGPIEAARAS